MRLADLVAKLFKDRKPIQIGPLVTKTYGVCNYCGGKKFFEGPGGGMAVNVICQNITCRHKFNASPFGYWEDLESVGEP